MIKKHIIKILALPVILFMVMQTGCAYYNTFYNAKKFYREAEKERYKREKTMVVELTEEEKATRKKSGQSANASEKPGAKEMQNYQLAIEKSSKVLEFFPNSKYVDDALILLGKCFYYRQEYKKAQRKFEEIQQLYPASEYIPESEVYMAKASLGLEDYDVAEEQFLAIVNKNDFPRDLQEEAKYELANLYFMEGEFEQAAENFASTSKEADDKLIRAMSIYKLGECNIRLTNYDESVKLFRRAVKASPNEDFKSQAMFKMGEAQSLQGNYENALDTFTRLLNTEFEIKRIPKIKLAIAENEQKSGNMESALKWYNDIIEEHKSTDAAAKSYYALGQIEEFQNKDYKKAKENYDLVRSAFANSLIAPQAKERSDNIRMLLDLNEEIAKLEGRYVESDSLGDADENSGEIREKLDNAPISLPPNGFWINYAGRHRPPPKSLLDLTTADMERSAENIQIMAANSDTSDSNHIANQGIAQLDSAAIAEMKAKQEAQKIQKLAEKRLALAEVLYFNFDKPDSAVILYEMVIDNNIDSSLTTRAMYSLGYLYSKVLQDSVKADTILHKLLAFNPNSTQALGAKQLLGMEIKSKVDSAQVLFKQAESAWWQDQDEDKALELYEKVINLFPNSDYAPKAEYARGWLYEQVLFRPEQAIKIYENIIDSYPESAFTKNIKPKLAAVEKALKEEEAKKAAIADSLAKLANAQTDSLALASPDSLTNSAMDSMATQAPDSIQSSLPADSLANTAGNTGPADSVGDSKNERERELPGAVKRRRIIPDKDDRPAPVIDDNIKKDKEQPLDDKIVAPDSLN